MVISAINLPIILYTLPTSSGFCVGYGPRPDGPLLTPITSLSMLLGTHSLAAFKQLELFWLYIPL
ncbi:inner membrane protein [Salmonella enterica subsp. enterica serovar Bovismorbificans]|uniref:Inner membrane protein n=1 Tax=Salmonella enterica subsp. enterica serovar Bovismorbificans TaxID=58097 RepID=A0A655D7D2_SALET|nr:inner membrane protein [Salmonella enterica subsp. enterica serovar Bovismorbificans]